MTYGIFRTSGPSIIINTPRKVSPKSEFGLRKVGVSCLQSQTFMPINSEGSEMACFLYTMMRFRGLPNINCWKGLCAKHLRGVRCGLDT